MHCLDTASYASRIAGVRTGRLAITSALFNLVALASRTANTLQAPLLGSAMDQVVARHAVNGVLWDFHMIIMAATIGTLAGAALIPSLAALFGKAAVAYESYGSFVNMLVHAMSWRGLSRIGHELRMPQPESVDEARRRGIPRSFLLLNTAVVAIYTTGILSTIYASALAPGLARTATTLSGVINGIGMVLLVLLVDPVSALVTDQAIRGARPVNEVSHVVVWQVAGRVAGTLLAQAIFLPAAYLVVWLAHLLA